MSFESHFIKPGLCIHIKPTKQFKTTTVRVYLIRNLDEETTKAAIIPYVLRRGTKNHPNMTDISRHLENLFGTAIGTDVSKLGEWQVLSIFADIPNEKYLPTRIPVLLKGLQFINELIFYPAGEKGFIEKYVNSEKENIRKFIVSLYEDRSSYSFKRLFDILCEGEPFSRYEYGELEKLKKINANSLNRFYDKMKRRIPIDIYITGDVESDRLLRSIENVFDHSRIAGGKLKKPIVKKGRRKIEKEVEHLDVTQARLLMGFRSDIAFSDRRSHSLAMASAILGGFSHSKLFRNIREKASLAYSIGSYMSRSKGIMVAYAGIEPGSEEKVRKMVDKEFSAVKSGKISNFELDSSKVSILDDLAAINDVPGKEIDFDFIHKLHGVSISYQEIAERISSMTKKDIAEAAESLSLDTVYILTSRKNKAISNKS